MDHTDHPPGQPLSDQRGHQGHGSHGGPEQQGHGGHDELGLVDHDSQHATPGDAHGRQVDHQGHEAMFRKRFWISLVLSLPVLAFSPSLQSWLNYSAPEFLGSQWITPILSIVIFAYGGTPFLRMARPELQDRQPGMMTLISLAISVAFVYSLAALALPTGDTFFWELATLIDVMLLGHWLEMRSVRQASSALDELAKLLPDSAELVTAGGETRRVSVPELHTGDLVLIRPGSSIPADGQIEQGSSRVDEALITGESRPQKKDVGDILIAGSINGEGSLRVRVRATGQDTALAGIMRLVEQAQHSKSRTQILADRAAGWLFYLAVGAAGLTAIAWTIAVGFQVQVIARVATVLVIACPHALGLAIPLVVAITTAIGAKGGVLVRDRLALEQARLIDIVVFDKTGTLTRGEFGVVAMRTAPGTDEQQALALAAGLEADSEHSIARAIRDTATERGLSVPSVSGFEAIKGRGVMAKIAGRTLHLGGPRLLEQLEIALSDSMATFGDRAGARGQSVVFLIDGDQVIAGLALADVVRPESKQAVGRLAQLGIQVAMLTGDSWQVAQAVADELGIRQVFAEVLPEHKDQKIAELQRAGHRVAMVGDGINDAPALVRADVGIAIGGGTDVAIESAGIVLVKNNPLDVVKVFELSRASYRKMVQNLVWATGYNVVAIPAAAGVLAPLGLVLSPAAGAALMSASTVVVAFNAQLLRRLKLASD